LWSRWRLFGHVRILFESSVKSPVCRAK
jgi:hypothetical protein